MRYSYRRVSTSRQELGPQAQADEIARWGAVDQDFCDLGVSGSIPIAERSEGAKLLSVLQDGDTVVVAKLDRLFRSVADAAITLDGWCKRDIKLVSLKESFDMTSPMGKFMSSVMAAFAELERAMIRERTSAALQAKLARGEHMGGIPYGWALVGGRLVEHPHEQNIIGMIRQWLSLGLKQHQVAEKLNRNGHVTKKGRVWTQESVSKALTSDAAVRKLGVSAINPEETNDRDLAPDPH